MESRMMLSATGFENTVPILDSAQFQIIPLRYVQTASDVTLTPLVTDGGFIQYRFELVHPDLASDVGTLAFNQHGTSVAGIISQNLFGVAGQDVNVLPPWQLTTAYDSDGLQPAVIVSQTNGTGLAPDLKPVVLGPNPSTPGAGEGGSIPIHAIFADFRKDSQLASGVKAVASPAIESSIESLASARRLPASDNALAGEWARAMVFEIAGGEPAANDTHLLDGKRTTTSDNDSLLQSSKPLSSVDTPQQNVKLVARHASAQPNEAALIGDASQPQSTQSNEQLAAIVAQLLKDGQLTPDVATHATLAQLLASNPQTTANPDVAKFAAAAAFDQLSDCNAAVIESSVDSKSWLRSIGTSPLLMVLALERIAALNSRRATRESRIAAAKKPLRLRG